MHRTQLVLANLSYPFCTIHYSKAKGEVIIESRSHPSQVWRRAAGGVCGCHVAGARRVELGHVEGGGLHELVVVLGAEDEAAHRHDDGDQGQDYDAARKKETEGILENSLLGIELKHLFLIVYSVV